MAAASRRHETPSRNDRETLPRALVGRRRWAFHLGQLVKSGEMIAAVIGRSETFAGSELYEVRVIGADGGRPVRSFRGQYLEAAGELVECADGTFGFFK